MFGFFLCSLVLRLGHHHLAELVKVHRARAVLVQLLEDALQLLLSEGGQQLGDETSKNISRERRRHKKYLSIKNLSKTQGNKTYVSSFQLLLCEGGQQLGDETSQCVRADEPLPLLVIQPVEGKGRTIGYCP